MQYPKINSAKFKSFTSNLWPIRLKVFFYWYMHITVYSIKNLFVRLSFKCHPQTLCSIFGGWLYQISVKSDFGLIFSRGWALCYSFMPNCATNMKADKQLFWRFVIKYFTLFIIVTLSIFHKSTLNIAHAVIITLPLAPIQISIQISGIWGCNSKLNIFCAIITKVDGGEELPFFKFCNWFETLTFISKFRLELSLQKIMI